MSADADEKRLDSEILDPSCRLEGWKNIGAVLVKSKSWCKKHCDPKKFKPHMPVWYIGRTPVITSSELIRWFKALRAATRK